MTVDSRNTTQRRAIIELVLAMIIGGTVGVFALETRLDAYTVVFFRCLFGGIFLGLLCLAMGYFRGLRLTRRLFALAVLSGVALVINWLALFQAFHLTSIAVSTMLYHLQPFWIVVMGAVFFGERFSADKFVWIIFAFVGLALAAGVTAQMLQSNAGYLLGVGLAILASFTYALTTVLTKGLGAIPPQVLAFIHTCIGVLMLWSLVDFAGLHAVPGASWGWLLGLGLIHTGLLYILMYSAYPKLQTPFIAVMAFIYPVVAIFADWLVYDRPISLWQGLGFLLIAGASLGVNLGWRILPRSRRPA
ncbi:DMT family transporter [Govanella unica]|uniref:DMT family transporter n=1 Tax=Govanella unica TaxID=2975056 RepID=A0A9X3TVR3_9PROT|nr:DMT family transporter [Govania unica]MDA5192876.1 DMT family transporter [Govania unica]